MKTIQWDTNINGKMACTEFVHIDLAPEKMPSMDTLEKTILKIHAKDNSHPPIRAKVHNIVLFPLKELANIQTWPSHGMDSGDFINSQLVGQRVHKDMQLAVYYYRRVDT